MAPYARVLMAIAIPAVFALARRYFPVSARQSQEESIDELDSRFASLQWLVGLGMCVVGVLLAWGLYAGLVGENRYLANKDHTALLVLYPQSAIWWFLPGFAALCLSWEITLQLMVLFGGRGEAESYSYWTSAKVGFDSTKVLRWMAAIIVLPIAILTFLELPVHVALGQDDIRDCGYGFAACKVYRYADARRMTIIDGYRSRDGKLERRAGIVMDFSDGRRWSSAEIGDFDAKVDPALQAFLAGKIALNYGHVATEAEIPPLGAAREAKSAR
jgi:hypothetical protein